MGDHRIRLTDDDLALIVAALRARSAWSGSERRRHIERLALRLAECRTGNPAFTFGADYPQRATDDD